MSDDRGDDAAADRDERSKHNADPPQPTAAAARRGRRDGSARPAGRAGRVTPAAQRSVGSGGGRESADSLVARTARFLREVVAELRKVIWPTRKQLVTYTAVVLVFVAFMVAVVFGLDTAFGRLVLYVFG